MKKIFTVLPAFFLLFFISASAQPGIGLPYTMSVIAYPGTPPGVPSVLPLTNMNDAVSNVVTPAGFSFTYGGIVYNGFVASTNGWVALTRGLANGTASPVGALPVNNLAAGSGTAYPIIAPLWDDLQTGAVTYALNGGVLWIRWSAMRWPAATGAPSLLLEVRFNTATNTIDFTYSNNAYAPGAGASASIGITGPCAGDYYSVDPGFATADNTTEYNTISTRPVNTTFRFTPAPPSNDNCAGAENLGTMSATCTPVTYATVHATSSTSGNICATADNNDVWFQVVRPANIPNITVSTAPASCNSLTGTSVEVFSGSCGALTSLGCGTTSTANANFGEVTLARSCTAETLYVRVTGDGNTAGKFELCIGASSSGGGATCANATNICSLPYNQTGMTTAGFGNDYDSTSSACHTPGMNGEDYVFSYTPAANQCIRISVNSTGSNPAVFVYTGCPDAPGTYCVRNAEAPTGNVTIGSVTLQAGSTYYIVVDNASAGGNIPFDISVTSLGTANSYDNCANAVNLGSIPMNQSCVFQTFSTECSSASPTSGYPIPNCATTPPTPNPEFINGVTGDVWMRFTAGFSGSLQINTQQSSSNPTSNAGMAIYTGSCGAFSLYACDLNSGPNGMPSLSLPVTNGTVYYIRVWTENPENTGNFDICFQSACAPPNDLPCQSVNVPIGGTATGYNTCASGTSEPPNAAQCAGVGTINTVWYNAVVPASGQLKIRTQPLTLTDTQIQAYTFANGCGNSATIYTSRGCNDDGPACSGGFNDFSQLHVTGLTPGDTLYVAVDGVAGLTGSFNITIIDGTQSAFPPVYQQDCGSPQIVCSTADIVVADPGWRNYGNVCDLPGSFSCWGVGERNSIWYQFTVDPALSGGTATVEWTAFSASSTDLDPMMWDITGLSNPCAQIATNSLPSAFCNYCASAAQTGMQTPNPGGCFGNAITFTGAPRTYLLLINNWNSAANAGYTLDWGNTPISTTGGTAIWSGTTDTLYTTATNWGDCGSTPTCGSDAIVNNTFNGRQPTVVGNQSVRNITINAGATLRIVSGATLSVCGNFTNLGNLIAEPGSTIQFIGNTAQSISGNLTGANAFANLTINKLGNTATLNTNIDVNGNFVTSSATSVFSINGYYMKVAGNFTNNSGTTTFTGTAASTVEFNGSGNQNFTNSNGSITLNRVVMNKTGGKLYLTGANSTMNIDSALTLTSGIIVTRSNAALEVNLRSNVTTAISGHNATSYVDGKLRRKIYVGAASPLAFPASFDWPVGDSTAAGVSRYELANITFTSSTVIPDIVAWFTPWPAAPPNGPMASECLIATYDILQLFNHGYWTFDKTGAAFNGIYNVTLNNTGFTNNTGQGWTVAKADITANPSLAASWSLIGNCVISSTPGNTQRSGINSPANASTSFDHLYTTAQSDQPLPIELLSFTAQPSGIGVLCKWTTASETNNSYFEVERSTDGENFKYVGRVDGYGPGVSTEVLHYDLMDDTYCNGIVYYKLKQFDIDGRSSSSEMVVVNCKAEDYGITLFPNPANTLINFTVFETEDSPVTASIIDVTGRTVKTLHFPAQKGYNTFEADINELAGGVYYLQVVNDNKENSIRYVRFFKN